MMEWEAKNLTMDPYWDAFTRDPYWDAFARRHRLDF